MRLNTIKQKIKINLKRALINYSPKRGFKSYDSQNLSIEEVKVSDLFSVKKYKPLKNKHPKVTICYFHGGGFIYGSLKSNDLLCSDISYKLDANLIAVDYRKAPEHPFPAAFNDCLSAVKWCTKQQHNQQKIVIMGDSAGASLCAAVANKVTGKIAGQILLYPCLNYETSHFRSYQDNAEKGLSPDDMKAFWQSYLPSQSDRLNPFAVPGIASDSLLKKNCPTLMITGKNDILHDEGVEYSKRLNKLGINTELHDFKDCPHGFFGINGQDKHYRDVLAIINQWLAKNHMDRNTSSAISFNQLDG